MIFRLRAWTHYERRVPRRTPGLRSAGFKAPPGHHAIVLQLGNVKDDEPLTLGRLRELAREAVAMLEDEAAKYSDSEDVGPPV